MRIRPPILIVVALLIGLVAAVLVIRAMSGGQSEVRQQIVVATADIAAGDVIAPEKIKTITWAASSLPQGVETDPAKVRGRVARLAIHAGDPILAIHLARRDAMAGMPAMIAPGKRAISIGADEVTGVAGFAMPGTFVDVLVSAKDGQGVPFSKIVLEGIKILAVEQSTQANPQEPKVVKAVTLEMTPFEAERLDLARSVGKIALVLRGEYDRQASGTRGSRMPDLVQGTGIVVTGPNGVIQNPNLQPANVQGSGASSPAPVPPGPMAGSVSPGVQPLRPGSAATGPAGSSSLAGNPFAIEEIRGTGRGSSR